MSSLAVPSVQPPVSCLRYIALAACQNPRLPDESPKQKGTKVLFLNIPARSVKVNLFVAGVVPPIFHPVFVRPPYCRSAQSAVNKVIEKDPGSSREEPGSCFDRGG
jgi:hypothetical protein